MATSISTTVSTTTQNTTLQRLHGVPQKPKWSEVVGTKTPSTASRNTGIDLDVPKSTVRGGSCDRAARKRSRRPRSARGGPAPCKLGRAQVRRSPPLSVLKAADTDDSGSRDTSPSASGVVSPTRSQRPSCVPDGLSRNHRQRFTTTISSLAQTMKKYRSSFLNQDSLDLESVSGRSSHTRNDAAMKPIPLRWNREAMTAMRISLEAFSNLMKEACSDYHGPRRPLGEWKDLNGTAADVLTILNGTLTSLVADQTHTPSETETGSPIAQASSGTSPQSKANVPRHLSKAQVESLQPYLSNLDRKLDYALKRLPGHSKAPQRSKTGDTARTGFVNPEAASTWTLFRHNSA